MDNVTKFQRWNGSVVKRTNRFRSGVLIGLGLAAVLGSLAGLNPLISVASVLVVLVVILVVRRPILIVYGLTIILPLTAGLTRGAVIPVLRLGQALLVVGAILFVLAQVGRLGKSRLTVIDLAFVLFFLSEAVFPVLALYYRGEHLNLNDTNNIYGTSPLQTLLGPIQFYLLYRIVVATISSERQIKVVLKLSFVVSIIVSVIGILEKIITPFRVIVETYYPQVNLHPIADSAVRIASTFQDYSGLGAYLAFTIILVLACYAAQKSLKMSPLLLAATILLDSIALILTATFAAWIGLAIGVVVICLLIGRMPKMVFFVFVGVVLTVIIFQPFISARLDQQLGAGAAQGLLPQSFAFRIMLWRETFLPAIGQHLLFGAGPDPKELASWSTEESEYFRLLLRGGLFQFLAYLLLIGAAVSVCWRQIRSKKKDASQPIAMALLAILVAISAMNVSAEYFTYAGGTQILWTLLAIVVACRQFKTLESSADDHRIIDDKKVRVILNMPSHSSSDVAATSALDNPVPWSYVPEMEKSFSSYSLVPHTVGSKMSWLNWRHEHFALPERLLDWSLVKDSLVVGVGSVIARVFGLLFWILLAHFITPDGFGFVRYSITLAGIIAVAMTASPSGIARFLAASQNDQLARDRYFSNGLFGLAILMAVSLLISVPVLGLLHALNFGTISCIVGLSAFYGYLALARGLNSAWKMSLNYALSNAALIAALCLILGLFRIRTVTAALMIYGLSNIVQIFIVELISPMALRFRPSLISKAVLLELARFVASIVVASGAYAIWNGIDLLMVENFYPHASGDYAVAKTLSGVFIIVPSVITMVLMPRVAASGSDNSKRYSAAGVLMAFLISLAGLAVVALWGNDLVVLVFGHRYSGGVYLPLLVLSAGMSFFSVYIVLEGFALGHGRPNLSAEALMMALVGTSATSFWLTSWLGPLGASLSFTIGAALGTLVMIFNTWRILRSDRLLASKQQARADPIPSLAQ